MIFFFLLATVSYSTVLYYKYRAIYPLGFITWYFSFLFCPSYQSSGSVAVMVPTFMSVSPLHLAMIAGAFNSLLYGGLEGGHCLQPRISRVLSFFL